MNTEPITRHSQTLPNLNFALNLLYVSRLLLGMTHPASDDYLDEIDERIEEVTDELVSTELLHEAAVLAGDVVVREDSTDCAEQ